MVNFQRRSTSFTLASLNHASKARGPRSIIVQPRNDQKKQGLKVTGNDDEAPDDEIGTAQKFVKQSSMSTELEGRFFGVFRRVRVDVQASCICFYVGNEVSSTWARRPDPVRKVGLLEAKRAEQRIGPGASWNPGQCILHGAALGPSGRLLVRNGVF